MSRVVCLVRPSARCSLVLAVSLLLLAGFSAGPVAAQERPACGEGRTQDCQLPDWSEAIQRDIPSLFGDISGTVWVEDARGDAPPAGLDILAVGIGTVDIADPGPIRDSAGLIKLGKVKKAVKSGPGVVVRVVLDRPLAEIDGDHSGVHIATDVDGSRSNNAPSGVGAADNPFAGSENVYSLTYASTTGKTRLLDSDLSQGWYKAKGPLAASWAAPNVLDLLLAPQAMGDGFRVITYVAADEGGYDSLALGPAPLPSNGQVGLVPICVEASISNEPFTVRRLVENGQTLRDVETPASWRGGATMALDEDSRAALEALIAATDEDGDGRVGLASTVVLFEDGAVIRQRPGITLALDADHAILDLQLGLARRGYHVLRDIELQPTGDAIADAWLERATSTLTRTMPPFRSTKKAGLVAGDGIGACIPLPPAAPEPLAAPTSEPAADAAAPSA